MIIIQFDFFVVFDRCVRWTFRRVVLLWQIYQYNKTDPATLKLDHVKPDGKAYYRHRSFKHSATVRWLANAVGIDKVTMLSRLDLVLSPSETILVQHENTTTTTKDHFTLIWEHNPFHVNCHLSWQTGRYTGLLLRNRRTKGTRSELVNIIRGRLRSVWNHIV